MPTAIAAFIVGIWLIVASQEHVSSTITLIVGLAAAALALFDIVPELRRRSRT